MTGLLLGITESLPALNLRIVSRSGSVVTIRWDAQICDGFRFYRNSKPVSVTFDGTRTSTRITALAGDEIEVRAIRYAQKDQITA